MTNHGKFSKLFLFVLEFPMMFMYTQSLGHPTNSNMAKIVHKILFGQDFHSVKVSVWTFFLGISWNPYLKDLRI